MLASLRRWLNVNPGEGRPVLLLFGWYFCVIGAAFAGRSVRDALFLANVGPDRLPLMYVVTPLVAAAVAPLTGALEQRLPRFGLVSVSLIGSAALMAVLGLAAGTQAWASYALYVAVNVMSGLIIGQVWMVASDRFTARDAKRTFGLIGAGGTAADIVVGGLIAGLAASVGAGSLVVLVVACLLGGAGCAWALRKGGSTGWEGQRRPPIAVGAPPQQRPPGTAHLRWLAVGAVCGVVAVTLVDFQFKAIAAEQFSGDPAKMATFFGLLSVGTGVVSLGVQLSATRWVLRHAGVAGALMVLPLGLGLGELALVAAPGLLVATVLKAGDEALRFTVHDAANQLSFLPVPSQARARFKSRIDAMWRPGAQIVLGNALLAYRTFVGEAVRPLAAIAIVGILGWLFAGWKLRGAYRISLAETLRSRPATLDGIDPADVPAEEWASLRAALDSADPAERVAAIELARPLARSLRAEIALGLGEAAPEVRRAAARALVGTDFPHWSVYAEDRDPQVRAVAMAGLAVAGEAGPMASVSAALTAAEGAELYVRACGPGAEPLLLAALPAATGATVGAILVRLGELGTPAARAALVSFLAHPRLGSAAARALRHATRDGPLTEAEAATVDQQLRAELEAAFVAMACADAMGRAESALAPDGTRAANPFLRGDPVGAAGLLSKALRERQEQHRERILWQLSARFPGAGLERVRGNLLELTATRRANAVELLDSTLRGELRTLVVALIDDTPRYEKLATAGKLLTLPKQGRDEWLSALLADRSPFVAACAAYYVGAHGIVPLRDEVAPHAKSPDPTLAETAAHALALLEAA